MLHEKGMEKTGPNMRDHHNHHHHTTNYLLKNKLNLKNESLHSNQNNKSCTKSQFRQDE